jgi:phosphoenolpyruvate carboxykinase (ATP)
MKQHGTRVWLVNTGWSSGAYGTGKRIKLANTRAIIDAIHSGALVKAKTQRDPVFGFDVVTECPNVPAEILIPRNVWADKAAFDAMAKKLAGLFIKNFRALRRGRERRSQSRRAGCTRLARKSPLAAAGGNFRAAEPPRRRLPKNLR